MKQSFAAMILGDTGQVCGGAAVAELQPSRSCSRRGAAGIGMREVVTATRKPIAARSRVRNVGLDTGAA